MPIPNFESCLCSNIQQALNDIAGKNAPSMLRDKTGLISFLKSPENTNGFSAIELNDPNGKFKQVSIQWVPRKGDSAVSDASCTQSCTAVGGNETYKNCDTVAIDQCFESEEFTIPENYMRVICNPIGETNQQWIATVIGSYLNAMNVKYEKMVAALLKPQIGVFPDGDIVKNVQLWNKLNPTYGSMAGSRVFPLYRILDLLDQTGYTGTPGVIGGFTDLNMYFRDLNISQANMLGNNPSAVANEVNYYYSKFLTSELGTDEFLVAVPGVAQLIEKDFYVGEYAKKGATFEHGFITDPISGITYGMKWTYQDWCDKYIMKLFKLFTVWTLPTDSYESSDANYGVNGLFNYKVCDEIVDCSGLEPDSSVLR
jgi:hypothetical protein